MRRSISRLRLIRVSVAIFTATSRGHQPIELSHDRSAPDARLIRIGSRNLRRIALDGDVRAYLTFSYHPWRLEYPSRSPEREDATANHSCLQPSEFADRDQASIVD